jgi:hypothetical protein
MAAGNRHIPFRILHAYPDSGLKRCVRDSDLGRRKRIAVTPTLLPDFPFQGPSSPGVAAQSSKVAGAKGLRGTRFNSFSASVPWR